MDFGIEEKTRELVSRVRAFVDTELIPVEGEVMAAGFVASAERLEGLRDQVREMGLFAPHIPKAAGGAGLSLSEFAHLSEVLGRTPIGHFVFNCAAPDVGNMELLLEHGTAEQKDRWLGPLVAGKIRSCFAMTEPEHAGSNPVWMSTVAEHDGDDYVITGHKWFTSSADGAQLAICMAVTDPEAESPYARASQILVPTDTEGYSLVRNISVMGHAGGGWASHGETRFDQVRVPRANLLGAEGAGFLLAQERLGPGRIHHCMRWIGICERAFDLMCDRAATRELAPGKPLGTRSNVQDWIAESRAEIDAARLMVLRTAWRIDREGAYAAKSDISIIKFQVAGVLNRVLDRAIQVHGGLGVTDDTPLASWYAHERAARIYDGPDEVHKSAVARRILRGHGMETRR